MKPLPKWCAVAIASLLAALPRPSLAQDGWQAVETVAPYAVSGTTAPALYESIGARGPKAGAGRAIAVTNFRLTWRRDYQRRGTSCVLASAVPKLTVTYSLPKPSQKLDPALQARWKVFHDGLAAHERVHGQHIVEMVRKIETVTVGFTEEDDPGCTKIRKAIVPRLAELSQEQRARSRDFDRIEMANGGAVHQLILNFLNGR